MYYLHDSLLYIFYKICNTKYVIQNECWNYLHNTFVNSLNRM